MGTPIKEYTPIKCEWGKHDEYPKDNEFHIYIKDNGVIDMVDFICPCGCGNRCPTFVVTMNEKQEQGREGGARNRWGFDPNTLTLTPSIRWTGGCKAHFNITNGKVIIHADSGK